MRCPQCNSDRIITSPPEDYFRCLSCDYETTLVHAKNYKKGFIEERPVTWDNPAKKLYDNIFKGL